jgi:hypothetical protein
VLALESHIATLKADIERVTGELERVTGELAGGRAARQADQEHHQEQLATERGRAGAVTKCGTPATGHFKAILTAAGFRTPIARAAVTGRGDATPRCPAIRAGRHHKTGAIAYE